ncbi:MAG: oligosaccharide flippase family protein [Bacteroidetes bacterium]|nr:oligosaccharide flippase family protein [Bacteroidota bacterium]
MLQKILHHGKYALLVSLTEKGVFFLLFVYLARISPTDQYGTIVATFALAGILNSLLEFGFGAYIQREVSARSASVERELNTILAMKGAGGIVYVALLFAYFSLFNQSVTFDSLMIIATLYLSGFAALFNKVLYGNGEFRRSFASLFSSRLLIPLGLGMLLLVPSLASMALMLPLISILMQTVVLSRYLRTDGVVLTGLFDKNTAVTVLRSSLPMGIGVAFVWIYDKVDVLLIQHLISVNSVALYSVAYSLYKMPQMAASMVLTPLYTELSKQFTESRTISLKPLRGTILFLIGSSMGAVVIFLVIPGELVTLIYGEQYRESAQALMMLSFALPALFLNNFTGVMLNSIRQERKAMTSAFWALIINVSLNVMLLPIIGLAAAILATICTEYSNWIIQCVYLYRSRCITWNQTH